MKKFIALFLSLLMTLNLSACKGQKENCYFSENLYTKINLQEKEKELNDIIEKLKLSDKPQDYLKNYFDWENEMKVISDNATYTEVRFNIDTKDEKNKRNKEIYDEFIPKLSAMDNEVLEIMISSPAKGELENFIGSGRLSDIKNILKINTANTSEFQTRESGLCMEFDILQSQAERKVSKYFSDLVRKLSTIRNKPLSEDEILYCFYKARNDYYKENKSIYEKILLELISIRKEIAKKSGFESYTDYCYVLNNRSSYNKDDIKKLRDRIKTHLSPVYKSLCESKKSSLELEALPYYYENNLLSLKEPQLKYKDAEITGEILACNISKKAKKCFKQIKSHNFMDIEARENKAEGAFTTSFSKAKMPFIFASKNDTLGFVNTFIHEFGHALSYYNSKNKPYNYDRSLDISEIHSHSMEILSLNFYDKILKTDKDEAVALYMEDLLSLILLSAMNDEFQQRLYEEEIKSIDDANKIYKELYKEYFYDFDYDGLDYFEDGGVYSAISHIYTRPFYMIDYTLAILTSLNVFYKMESSYKEAITLYENIIDSSKDLSFSELLQKNGLKNPVFDEESVKDASNCFKKIFSKYVWTENFAKSLYHWLFSSQVVKLFVERF